MESGPVLKKIGQAEKDVKIQILFMELRRNLPMGAIRYTIGILAMLDNVIRKKHLKGPDQGRG